MSQKVIYFFPHNPCPPKSGAHKRCLEMLTGLHKLGYEVTFVSSTLSSETNWDDDSIEILERDFVRKVIIYQPSFLDWKVLGLVDRFYKQIAKTKPPLASVLRASMGMRWWFADLVAKIVPDLIMTSYCFWDGLINHQKLTSIVRVVDTIDLFTINSLMANAVSVYLQSVPMQIEEVDDAILQEDFFDRLNLVASDEELKIYDRYDRTIAIARNEFDIIKDRTSHTSVSLLPMTQQPCYLENQYNHSPLFTTGPNSFNLQGYLYFAKRVLPDVLAEIPSFELEVTGSCCQSVTAIEGIKLSGFVPDLRSVYQHAKFFVCPVFGGTGQQVKIVEAMANGLPVIALKAAAKMSPIEHGINGLIANDAVEFAQYVIQLWQDRTLCRQMGTAARAKIASDFSEQCLLDGLRAILQS